jgi:[protein-PII] uridylyltransferase
MDFDLTLETAKILTEGEKVNDIFYLTDKNGEPISDLDVCMQLRNAVISELEDQVELQASI